MPDEEQQIPISDALSEADPQSIQELFSRNPENFSDAQIDRVIALNRDLQSKMESAPGGRVRQVRAKAPKISVGNQVVNDGSSPSDYGM